ncbi:ATP-binding protein [Burkholderia sola]|uniref:ATP-binding protein n=1 Tax=Burkholderia TaxID=32008 RepID=UPI001AEAF64B|nr:ATP-binding protein [Burkholderia sp. AcTa6-5]MBP0714234.1 ATP-binding protein [Burkholderia sp. AcTa6-5]
MSTIRLQTNQNRLIANLRHAFTQASMLGELLQNARRAQASHIHITVEDNVLTVSDDGTGIADLQTLISIAESGWDKSLQARENAFGLGVLSTLYFAHSLRVHSLGKAFRAETASLIRGEEVEVISAAPRAGTEIRLHGVHSPQTDASLQAWVANELTRLCEAFPVPVVLNGTEIPRPLADPSLPWRQTTMGKVLIDLSGTTLRWRCFLQGLPIGDQLRHSHSQIVLLPDDTLARLPDRQHLLNEAADQVRIQAAMTRAYREALVEAKDRMAPREFIECHAQNCIDSRNADLLNDVPFARLAWFRSWEMEPAGIRRFWDRYQVDGLASREDVEASGVWIIEADDEHLALAAQTYLEATEAFLLEESRLDEGHWLIAQARVLAPDHIQVRPGAIIHHDSDPGLADYEVELTLVSALEISLEGQSGYPADAVRDGNTLYLTATSNAPTKLISDYIFDDRYSEDQEDRDKRTLRTFVAVGCSVSPARVVDALLPSSLRFTKQPKLAGATVRLTFDDDGKLAAVQ